jgi:hypothetical protein
VKKKMKQASANKELKEVEVAPKPLAGINLKTMVDTKR